MTRLLLSRTPTFEQELNSIIRRDHTLQNALRTSRRLGEQLLKGSQDEQEAIGKLTSELLKTETRCGYVACLGAALPSSFLTSMVRMGVGQSLLLQHCGAEATHLST